MAKEGILILNLDPCTRRLHIRNRSIKLRNKEFFLMTYLLENIGKVVSRTQLLEEVWDRNVFCSTNTVDVHVSSLRQKIRRYLKRDVIRTVHCIGYILTY